MTDDNETRKGVELCVRGCQWASLRLLGECFPRASTCWLVPRRPGTKNRPTIKAFPPHTNWGEPIGNWGSTRHRLDLMLDSAPLAVRSLRAVGSVMASADIA
jgi:hypothetical protein